MLSFGRGLARVGGALASRSSSSALPSVASSSLLSSKCQYSTALTSLSEEEQMLRETVQRFAEEKIGPKVAEMDQNHKVDSDVLNGLFEQGMMGIEIPAEYGGGGMSFFDSIIAIEEIAKVDAFVFFAFCCFVLLCCVLFCFVLFCFVLFCFVLFCFVLFCFVLFCFVLFCS